MDGGDDVGVGAAAADVAVHGLLDVAVGGADGSLEGGDGRHDLAGGAVAALIGVVLDERGLHGVQVAGLADAFNGGDLVVRVHDGEGEAGVDAAAIDVDGACSALAVVAALLGAGKVRFRAGNRAEWCGGRAAEGTVSHHLRVTATFPSASVCLLSRRLPGLPAQML